MPYGYTTDPELDRSTNRVMAVGAFLLLAWVAAFPLYLNYEPSSREESRDAQAAFLAEEGAEVSSVVSKGGFEPRPRDTLGDVEIDFPIPYSRMSFDYT